MRDQGSGGPSRSVVEIVQAAGFEVERRAPDLVVRIGSGRANVENYRGLANFSISLPRPVARFFRLRSLRNVLRASCDTPYLKFVFVKTGGLALATQIPMELLTPRVAEAFLRSLGLFTGMDPPDLFDDRRFRKRLDECMLLQATAIALDVEETGRDIVRVLRERGLQAASSAGGFRTRFGGGQLDVLVLPTGAAVSLRVLLGTWPKGDKKAYMSTLLSLSFGLQVAKVGLDRSDEVVFGYDVPRLSPYALQHAETQLEMATRWVRALDAGGSIPET